MRYLVVLFSALVLAQAAQADIAFTVEGRLEQARAWGGLTFYRIVTASGEELLLEKASAKGFKTCKNGSYQVVNSTAITTKRPIAYTLLDSRCRD